jgi:hypothetical protein
MMTQYIESISDYCDRWCERCAFTSRCGEFVFRLKAEATQVHHERSQQPCLPPSGGRIAGTTEAAPLAPGPEVPDRWPTIADPAIVHLVRAIATLSERWLAARHAVLSDRADVVLAEAIAVAARDSTFIIAKLHRALERRSGTRDRGDPIQNDWNGSAKIALIAVERSEVAWRIIGQATGEDVPAAIAGMLGDLHRETERAFPDAWAFVRPGFDRPG